MAELIEDVLELLAPWPTANSLATTLRFESANEASTSAQLAVPLLVTGMVQRLKDPAVARGVLDLLPLVDTDGLRDLEGVFRERLFEPVGSDAVDQILAGLHERAGSAVAEEVGCTTASSYGVFPAMAWLVLGVISERHGAAHNRHTLLNVVQQEEAALLRTGWGVWMSVVGPEAEPSSPPKTTSSQVLKAEKAEEAVEEPVTAAPSYPPPVSRESRRAVSKPVPPVEPSREAESLPDDQQTIEPFPPDELISDEPVDLEPVLQQQLIDQELIEQQAIEHKLIEQQALALGEPTIEQALIEDLSTDEESLDNEQRTNKRQRSATVPRSYGDDDDAELNGLEDLGPAPPGRGLLLIGAMLLLALAGALIWYLAIRDQTTIATESRTGETDSSAVEAVDDETTSSTSGVEGITPVVVTLSDPSGTHPDITGTASLQIDVDGGQICYEIISDGFDGSPSGVISQSEDGEQARTVADFGRLEDPATGCVPTDPPKLEAIRDDPAGHVVTLFSPDRTISISGRLADSTVAEEQSEQLAYDPDSEGAYVVIEDGKLTLEGKVPDVDTASRLEEEFFLLGELGPSDVDNRLEVASDAPVPSGRIVIQDDLLFDVGSADLAEQESASLSLVVEFFTARPDWQIAIIGHTDNTGSAVTNLALSQARAEAVRDRLIELGVNSFALEAVGVGDSNPVADNDTEVGREMNRRIEFEIRSRSGG